MQHLSPFCAYIHCFVSINIHQTLICVNGCNFLHMEEFSFIPLLYPRFYVRCHSVRVALLPSVTQQQNVTEYWWEGSTTTATSPTSASDVGQHNKIRGTTFGAAFVKYNFVRYISNKTYFNLQYFS